MTLVGLSIGRRGIDCEKERSNGKNEHNSLTNHTSVFHGISLMMKAFSATAKRLSLGVGRCHPLYRIQVALHPGMRRQEATFANTGSGFPVVK